MTKKPISEINATMRDDPDLEFYQTLGNTFTGSAQKKEKSEGDKIKSDLGPESGGPIRTEPEKKNLEINTRSKLDQSTAIQVIKCLKRMLNKYNCLLKDYHIKFHNEGFDITKIRIIPHDVSDLMLKLDKAKLIQFRDKPAAIAMVIIADELRQVCSDELALKVKAYAYDGADVVSLTVTNEDPEEEMDEFAAMAPELEAMAGAPETGLEAPEGAELGGESLGGPLEVEAPEGEEEALEAPPEETAEEMPEEAPEETADSGPGEDEDLDAAIADLAKSIPKKK